MSSYSTFFRLGLSLACEPKDYAFTYSYPTPVTPTTTHQFSISIQTPAQTQQQQQQQRTVARRRRSSLTVLTSSPMSTVKSTSTIRAATEAVRGVVVKASDLNELVNVETENVPSIRKIRRKTVTAPPPILLSLHHRIPAPPSRFPPPTSPLPPTPFSPSFSTWSQKNSEDSIDPVLPQTPI